ncbi:MAG: hypothetical protein JW821_11825 [Deltaproteobacteria bacterium]|nr:hypothetical protein [Deltaproteobacteria bacterium]
MEILSVWMPLVLNAVIAGGVYSLVAIGYTMVYGILKFVNFAHGDLAMVSACLLCYLHWQFRYIPRLRKMAPDPVFEIHPATASEYGLSEKDWAEIRTPHGSIRIRAHLSPGIRPDTLHMPHGWEEANTNELTCFEGRDPVSGFPNLKPLP